MFGQKNMLAHVFEKHLGEGVYEHDTSERRSCAGRYPHWWSQKFSHVINSDHPAELSVHLQPDLILWWCSVQRHPSPERTDGHLVYILDKNLVT